MSDDEGTLPGLDASEIAAILRKFVQEGLSFKGIEDALQGEAEQGTPDISVSPATQLLHLSGLSIPDWSSAGEELSGVANPLFQGGDAYIEFPEAAGTGNTGGDPPPALTWSRAYEVPRIFISHGYADRTFCARLAQDLRALLQDDAAVWCETTAQGALSLWWDSVLYEVQIRDIFIVVLSPDFVKTRLLQSELSIALEKKARIVPLLLLPCDLRDLPEAIRAIPSIDFGIEANYARAFDQLLKTLGLFGYSSIEARRSRLESPRGFLVHTEKRKIRADLGKGDLGSVLQRISTLFQRAPGFVDAELYRLQALVLARLGYSTLAIPLLDVALALVSEKRLHETALETYAGLLITLERWVDLVKITSEALRLVSYSEDWLLLQNAAYAQIGTVELIDDPVIVPEKPVVPVLPPENKVSSGETETERDHQSKKNIFISFTKDATEFRSELYLHLSIFEKQGLIEVWDTTKLQLGDRPAIKMKEAREVAQVAILLVNKRFLNSQTEDLTFFLAAAERGQVRIVPVVLDRFSYDLSPLAHLLPANAVDKPVKSMGPDERDALWDRVTRYVVNQA